jgi:hypothetical protein
LIINTLPLQKKTPRMDKKFVIIEKTIDYKDDIYDFRIIETFATEVEANKRFYEANQRGNYLDESLGVVSISYQVQEIDYPKITKIVEFINSGKSYSFRQNLVRPTQWATYYTFTITKNSQNSFVINVQNDQQKEQNENNFFTKKGEEADLIEWLIQFEVGKLPLPA